MKGISAYQPMMPGARQVTGQGTTPSKRRQPTSRRSGVSMASPISWAEKYSARRADRTQSGAAQNASSGITVIGRATGRAVQRLDKGMGVLPALAQEDAGNHRQAVALVCIHQLEVPAFEEILGLAVAVIGARPPGVCHDLVSCPSHRRGMQWTAATDSQVQIPGFAAHCGPEPSVGACGGRRRLVARCKSLGSPPTACPYYGLQIQNAAMPGAVRHQNLLGNNS